MVRLLNKYSYVPLSNGALNFGRSIFISRRELMSGRNELRRLRGKRYPSVHFIGTAPSLNINETIRQIDGEDLVVLCNRGYRLASHFLGFNVIYVFFDENIKHDEEVYCLPDGWAKFSGYANYSKRLSSAGFRFINDNQRLYKIQQRFACFPRLLIGRDRWVPSGQVSFVDEIEAVLHPHYTVAYGVLQLVAILKPGRLMLHGCDFQFSSTASGSYTQGVYSSKDRQDLEGQLQGERMVETMNFGLSQLRNRNIECVNGSSASKFRF